MFAGYEPSAALRTEEVLRGHVERAYSEARHLVFDVITGPPPYAGLTPRQAEALRVFEDAELELQSFREQHLRPSPSR